MLNYYYDSAGKLMEIGYKATATAAETYYYAARNNQGDIVALYAKASKALVGTYTYDAWGRVMAVTTSSDPQSILQKNPFRYRGYYYDAETGWYYLQSRYYDPEVKRFISADSTEVLKVEQGSVNQYNLYAYCLNNPVNGSDPSGYFVLSAMLIGAGIGALIGGISAGISAHQKGENVVAAVVGGVLTGGIMGGLAGSGVGLLPMVIAGGLTRGGNSIVQQAINTGEVNIATVAIDTGLGALSGLANGAVGSSLVDPITNAGKDILAYTQITLFGHLLENPLSYAFSEIAYFYIS